jgi:hypothetical protein
MDLRHDSPPVRPPPEWQPLVSSRQWARLARALGQAPEVLDDLRVVLAQLSPAVRNALLDNLTDRLAAGTRPALAVWEALATTGHEARLRSAALLGRLHALGDDAPDGDVQSLPRPG